MNSKLSGKELASYLRCSISTTPAPCPEECPYLVKEKIVEGVPMAPDTEIDGIGYWIGCDCDRMVEDAARMLEEMGDDTSSTASGPPSPRGEG